MLNKYTCSCLYTTNLMKYYFDTTTPIKIQFCFISYIRYGLMYNTMASGNFMASIAMAVAHFTAIIKAPL